MLCYCCCCCFISEKYSDSFHGYGETIVVDTMHERKALMAEKVTSSTWYIRIRRIWSMVFSWIHDNPGMIHASQFTSHSPVHEHIVISVIFKHQFLKGQQRLFSMKLNKLLWGSDHRISHYFNFAVCLKMLVLIAVSSVTRWKFIKWQVPLELKPVCHVLWRHLFYSSI